MRLTQFGTYVLPLYNKRDTVGTGDTGGSLINLISGSSYDHYGADTAPEATTTISTSYEIIDSTATAVQTARDAVRALAGQRDKLWAQFPDGTTRFVWARLARVRMERQREYIYYQPVELTFQVATPGWNGIGRGENWLLDSGEYLDDGLFLLPSNGWNLWQPTESPLSMAAANTGNRIVTNAVLTVTAGSDTITGLTVVCSPCDWTWTGTIAIGKSLVIDCGLKSILNDSVNAYSGFTLNAGHTVADWLRIAAGGSTIAVTYSGNASDSATFVLAYYDGWM